jgi:hypothetical protein
MLQRQDILEKVMQKRQFKTCYVSAPSGLHLSALRESLVSHGIQPIIPQGLAPGTDWASEIQQELQKADFVIGVLPARQQSQWVLFELGQAWALGKQILLIAPPGSESVPFEAQRFLVLRIDVDNREAIDFALEQLLSAQLGYPTGIGRKPYASSGLGAQTDTLLREFDGALQSGSERELEQISRKALQNSGADIVVESPRYGAKDLGADFAVWSDVLEPFVGNPLLVELKRSIKDAATANQSFEQLKSYLAASNSKWALLLYAEGPPPEDRTWRLCPQNVLIMPIRSLIEGLRDHAFPEIIRDLRNRRVHSVRP